MGVVIIDRDTTDGDVLNATDLIYEGGLTWEERMEQDGYDTSDMAGLAKEYERRNGPLPDRPPITDH